MDDLKQRVFEAFQSEHKKHLAVMRGFLASWTEGAEYAESELEDIRRSAHTLKGAARAAGLECVQDLGMRLERFFGRLKKGTLACTPRTLVSIGKVLDGIEAHVAAFAKDPGTAPPNELADLMDRLLAEEPVQEAPDRGAPTAAGEANDEPPLPSAPVPNDALQKQVMKAFRSEYRIHLETMRRLADGMTTGEPPTEDDINTAFRSAHTLKGAARAVDLPEVQRLAHSIETVFAAIRDGALSVGNEVIRAVTGGLDAIEDHVVSFGGPAPSPIPRRTIEAIEGLVQHPSREPSGRTAGEPVKAPASPLPPPSNGAAAIRIDADRMDRIQKTAEQIMAEGLRNRRVAQEIEDLGKRVSVMAKDAARHNAVIQKTVPRIKDQPEVLELVQFVQDQRQHLSMLAAGIRDLERRHTAAGRIQDSLSRQIQTRVQKARMVAAEDVFQFFRKMIRDLAADEGKQIDFKVKGIDIHADRLVLQRLKDPLMHMLRNAVSHGIETPREREATGKAPIGTVRFSIETDGKRMRITVGDDGKGLDAERICAQAVKKGYAVEDQIAEMSDRERLQFIYRHGFSTAGMITDLHGRGIGMAVVRDAVNRLRGEIDVHSEAGRGTRFVLSIPLTISTHRLLLVKAGGQTFGLPAPHIDRLRRIGPADVESVEGRPVILHEHRPVPFARLADLLEIAPTPGPRTGGHSPAVLCRASGRILALGVDDVLTEAEFLIKDLPPPADRIPLFSGGFVGADGSASLILNPAMLLDALRRFEGREAPSKMTSRAEEKRRASILIVDDSVTTRTLEKTLLEAQGYDVAMAVDGLEALDLMHRMSFDLVVTDIQMPNMDGFTLIEEMKKSETLKEMPVIIVTSMADQKDRQRGLHLGADAYIVKQKFDQKNLLEAIGQIL